MIKLYSKINCGLGPVDADFANSTLFSDKKAKYVILTVQGQVNHAYVTISPTHTLDLT